MENFSNLSHEDKRAYLNEIAGKHVCMMYDYSDLPDGRIGPECITGKISALGVSSFTFDPDHGLDTTLTIDGIISIETK